MTEYEDILAELKDKIGVHAKDYVPRLAHALKKEDSNRTGSDIVDMIKASCGYWGKDTIRNNMPKELLDEVKQAAGKKGKKAQEEEKEKITVGADGQSLPISTGAENSLVTQKEQELRTFNEPLKVGPIEETAAEIAARDVMIDGMSVRIKELERLKPMPQNKDGYEEITLEFKSFDLASLKKKVDRMAELHDKKITIEGTYKNKILEVSRFWN